MISGRMMGVLASMATGALIGALYAPDKGEVNRKKLARKVDELKEKFGKAVDKIVENLHKMEQDAAVVETNVKSAKREMSRKSNH